MDNSVPYMSLYEQLNAALSTLQVQGIKAVEHEDTELNNDFSVDPLADPRLDKMDLFDLVKTEDRDKIMSANPSYASADSDMDDYPVSSSDESSSDSGSGE